MRQRRIKNEKEKVMLYESYLLSHDKALMKDVFHNDYPVHMEIGCGRGKFINTLAEKNKTINYVAMESIGSVIIRALEKTAEKELENLKYFWRFADSLLDYLGNNEIDKLYLNFSDPWPKERHARRRLTHENFLTQYKEILKPEGIIEFKTDNAQLYAFTIEEFKKSGLEIIAMTEDLYASEFIEDNVATEYEEKFVQLGYRIHYIKAQNIK